VITVGKYTNNTQVAIYDTCVMLSFVIMLPFVALVKSSEPFMKSLVKVKEAQEKYKNNLKFSIELSLGVLLLFLIASKDILYIFGEVYINGSDTLIILSVSYMFLIMLGTPIEVLNMNGYTKISSIILVLSILINIILNIFLIPKYGIIGASMATGASLIFSKLFGLYIVKTNLKIGFLQKVNNFKLYFIVLILFYINILIHTNSIFKNILIYCVLIAFYIIGIIVVNNKFRGKTL
jgi:O-antigen/teichoic acid export membrane protein